jgi:hypothetical protein
MDINPLAEIVILHVFCYIVQLDPREFFSESLLYVEGQKVFLSLYLYVGTFCIDFAGTELFYYECFYATFAKKLFKLRQMSPFSEIR